MLALLHPVRGWAARNSADLQPPIKRQASLALAHSLVNRANPDPLPSDLVSPFNPPSFDKADPSAAVSQLRPGLPAAAIKVIPPDREILEKLAGQISPTGVIHLRGAPRLVIGSKPFEVGTRFTATYNSQDYELELVSIDRTTFTLRYRGEEITRPIKPVR
ncbi:MAG: hypothetical protein ABIQ12_11720 [Opitutaceae bacterium]